jgi:hypothetical protein
MGDAHIDAGIAWTSARNELCALFHDIHPDVADLYSQAVDALSAVPLSRPRLMIGSHCIRWDIRAKSGRWQLASVTGLGG